MDARKYKANRGETRQGKSDIKHLLQQQQKRNTIYYKQKEKLEVFATVTSKFQVLLFVI